jgi:hypothetical protein
MNYDELPGAELVVPGLADLEAGRLTVEALVVAVGRPRLTGLGVHVPPGPADASGALYDKLCELHGDGAHAAYNGLLRRLVSFERALDHRRTRDAA